MNKHSKVRGLSIFALTVMVMAAIATLHSRGQNTSVTKDEPPSAKREKLTLRQREHGKLFDGHHGPKLRDLAARQQGDISVWEEEPYMVKLPDDHASQLPFMQFAVCNADAIVIGTLTSETPQLTPSENFIFTDYEMSVEEVIKANVTAPTRTDKFIVTREGGTLHQGGRTFHADVEGFKPFAVGERYLLFLRYIPKNDAYLAYANGSFQLDSNKIIALGKLPESQPRDLTAFLSEAQAAVANSHCAKLESRLHAKEFHAHPSSSRLLAQGKVNYEWAQ